LVRGGLVCCRKPDLPVAKRIVQASDGSIALIYVQLVIRSMQPFSAADHLDRLGQIRRREIFSMRSEAAFCAPPSPAD